MQDRLGGIWADLPPLPNKHCLQLISHRTYTWQNISRHYPLQDVLLCLLQCNTAKYQNWFDQTYGALSLKVSSNCLDFWYILYMVLEYMMLSRYMYFATWLIGCPLKYTLYGLVSANPIHLVLISFTPICYFTSKLKCSIFLFLQSNNVLETIKRSFHQEEMDKYKLMITNRTFLYRWLLTSRKHFLNSNGTFSASIWFAPISLFNYEPIFSCPWHICLSYCRSCAMILHRSHSIPFWRV